MAQDPLITEYIDAWVRHFLARNMADSGKALDDMERIYGELETQHGREKARHIDAYVNVTAHQIVKQKMEDQANE